MLSHRANCVCATRADYISVRAPQRELESVDYICMYIYMGRHILDQELDHNETLISCPNTTHSRSSSHPIPPFPFPTLHLNLYLALENVLKEEEGRSAAGDVSWDADIPALLLSAFKLTSSKSNNRLSPRLVCAVSSWDVLPCPRLFPVCPLQNTVAERDWGTSIDRRMGGRLVLLWRSDIKLMDGCSSLVYIRFCAKNLNVINAISENQDH